MGATRSETEILEITDAGRGDGGRRRPVLVVVRGDEIGRRFLLNEPRLVLGRNPDQADLVLADPSVSGRHALLEVDPEGERYAIGDLGSRNGTWLNGARIERGPLREGDKIFVGSTVLKFSFHDSIEERFHGELDRLIHVDSLTGLYVRRWFDREYPRAFARARAGGSRLCVAMMDLDGLKAVNDRHGHQMGSYCISEAGRLIKACLPASAAAARFGGDEFVGWLADAELDDACDVAETIRRRIESFEFRRGEIVVAPTISIGVAALVPGVGSAEELLRLADDALYRAKKRGRNVVSR